MKEFIMTALPWIMTGLCVVALAARVSRRRSRRKDGEKKSGAENDGAEGMCLDAALGTSLGISAGIYQKKIGAALIVCVLLFSLTGCAPSFAGNSVKSADSYALDIEAMNGTDSHTLELEQGNTLQIQFETVKGSLSMEITSPDGSAIYQGNGTEATEFTMEAHADGAYTISVAGKKAQGRIRVDVAKAPAFTAEKLVGPWHLEPGENDEAAINESFPGAMEFGNSMEITGDGHVSWYIGAEGGSGTYTLDGDSLRVETISGPDGSAMSLALRAERTDGKLSLVMEVRNLSLRWFQGEGETGKGQEAASEEEPWKAALAKDLFEKYGVIPEYYEDLGDGIYQVYVKVGSEVVPFVTVDSATGDYHG